MIDPTLLSNRNPVRDSSPVLPKWIHELLVDNACEDEECIVNDKQFVQFPYFVVMYEMNKRINTLERFINHLQDELKKAKVLR